MISQKDLKLIRSLSLKKYREKWNLFIIEGKRVLEEALNLSTPLSGVFYTAAFSAVKGNQALLLKIGKNLTPEEVTEKEMKIISPSVSPPGLLAFSPIPAFNFSAVENKSNWIYLDGISDPGNMGTLLRTAAWYGIHLVGLGGDCISAYNPKVVRAAMGAHFYLKFMGEINLERMKKTHLLVGADQRGSDKITHPLEKPVVLLLGSEAQGLSAAAKKQADLLISVKKYGQGESLNVGVAAGILLDRIVGKNL
ncbi:MAG: RNA methyltransferase [Candidatus Neomarinimicrobiota bacterium]